MLLGVCPARTDTTRLKVSICFKKSDWLTMNNPSKIVIIFWHRPNFGAHSWDSERFARSIPTMCQFHKFIGNAMQLLLYGLARLILKEVEKWH
jgi:hypothetical protein